MNTKLWLSHSSISDFLNCPRAYYLKNVYKDENSGNKIQIVTPPLALGSAIHEVMDQISIVKTDLRFETPLVKRLDNVWEKYTGKLGGYISREEENAYKERGEKMLNRVRKNPGPIARPAVKINMELPNFPITSDGEIILCGKIDWLEYIPEEKSVNIIDFKTSFEAKEDPESLQLPIYYILAKKCQKHEVTGVNYWYLEQNDSPTPKELPNEEEAMEKILSIGRRIKIAKQLNSLNCTKGGEGCRYCKPYERILKNEGEKVKVDKNMKKDIYILPDMKEDREGIIL